MVNLIRSLRRWRSPKSNTTQNDTPSHRPFALTPPLSPSSATHATTQETSHVGELPSRPHDARNQICSPVHEAPPARGQEQTQRWLESNGAAEHVKQLTTIRDDAAKQARSRKFGRRRRSSPATTRPATGAVYGHPIPASIAHMSFRWINITMYDIYHPLGDHDSYFVWFAGHGCPYPRVSLAPDAKGPIPSEWLKVPKSEKGQHDPTIYWIGKEREICRARGLPFPPYPPPFTHLNEAGEEHPPRFISIDVNLFNKDHEEVDAAVGTFAASHSPAVLHDHISGARASSPYVESDAETIHPAQQPTQSGAVYWQTFEVSQNAEEVEVRDSMSSWSSWRDFGSSSDSATGQFLELAEPRARGCRNARPEDEFSGNSVGIDGGFWSLQEGETVEEADIWSDDGNVGNQQLPCSGQLREVTEHVMDRGVEEPPPEECPQLEHPHDGDRKSEKSCDSEDDLIRPPFRPTSAHGIQALRTIRHALELGNNVPYFQIQEHLIRNPDILRHLVLQVVPGSSLYDWDLDNTFERNCTDSSVAATTLDAIFSVAWPAPELRRLLHMLMDRYRPPEVEEEYLELMGTPRDENGMLWNAPHPFENDDLETLLTRVRPQPSHRPQWPSMLRHSVSADIVRSAGSPFGEVAVGVARPPPASLPNVRYSSRV
ncbi:hypothetical protein LIA77_01286 [Sarocladium implicatum]|nr:hypothetical protein LIA77_01286 [Sarocladium implicatum]